MNTIILFQKNNCPLCEEVKSLINVFATDYPISLKKVDIEQDESLMEKYLYEVPVIEINGEELDYRSIDYLELKERLK